MYAGAYLEPSRATMREILCKNHKKTFCRCSTWSEYASGIGFVVEKVSRMSMVKVDFKNLSLPFCFSN